MIDGILKEMNQPDNNNLDKIIDQMLENETRLEALQKEIAEIEVEQSELKQAIKEQWELTQTKGMRRGDWKLDLKPIEKWSISLENVDTIVPLLEEIGQNGVLKRTIHHATLNRILWELVIDKDNQYIKQFPELKEVEPGKLKLKKIEVLKKKYPGLKLFQGNVLKIKKEVL